MKPDLKLTMYHNILDVIKSNKQEDAASQLVLMFEKYINDNTKPLGPEDLMDSELKPKKNSFTRIR